MFLMGFFDLDGNANSEVFGNGRIADLQLTEGAESDRLEVWRYGENYEYEIDHK